MQKASIICCASAGSCGELTLVAGRKKGKFLHFLRKEIELLTACQKSDFIETNFCKNLTFWTLDSKVPKIEKTTH